ncbi:MAG: hypothetical protein ACRBF0_17665 [Calditrichia bacterium]
MAKQFWSFYIFGLRSYLRQHRYLLDLVIIGFFIILFEGFLKGTSESSEIWWVFAVLGIVLNFLTAPLVFNQERGNSLYFLLAHPNGRKNLLLSKIALIISIDLFWVAVFALAYGVRFPSMEYFLFLVPRMLIITCMLWLNTLLLSFTFTHKPHWSWLIFLLIVLGFIVNKQQLFPIDTISSIGALIAFILPPFFELAFLGVELQLRSWSLIFLGTTFIYGYLLWRLSYRLLQRKDFA